MAREYDKLVRDSIPEIIERNGETPVIHTAAEEEYERRLREKLDEEVAEFEESGDIEELADVLEVVYAIRDQKGISAERLEELRAEKARERGRFEEGVVLERVE
ncbi:Predicted house-cleaning noncanonical NTP pyrophosphatase, all-alpha NTP-PPase (MazG) superfamily [Halobiforma haloterrestris]|uniref:Predicted house-cleaning noncanonical NTP pyrophosphatase, all-alpha NTP-PPase (MazG) superfamily n=1 Tax=Natronobacterium haloterrestre TaxID=148448 RepID=A0A1I1EXN7_NATHA|nr:nucleoside triphosphate pyrophosphohydrolase [Halobiforma haloterrestris]SFB91949.1 Predicted house-cleaning noncanonical NTP pyrophosphatase, all-alpha NTP-PPase (MazG) superfamily [Halobiforma haloterrestris]